VTVESVLTIDEEFACLMPASSDSEFESIKLSIEEHHQCHVPIFVNQDGDILDGHLRDRACRELGIKPEIRVKRFENRLEETKFIIDLNLNRRHLNEFQRIELQRKLASIESQLAKGVNEEQKK
ncbi:MAG: ParB N-terminal domain-containing protein, partial [Candidatus Nitrosopolaris sp.]